MPPHHDGADESTRPRGNLPVRRPIVILRTLTYALIILALLVILQSMNPAGAFAVIISWIAYGSYIPFSLSAAGAVTDSKAVIIGVFLITLLSAVPAPVEHVARAIAPIGVGIALGVGIRSGVQEAARE